MAVKKVNKVVLAYSGGLDTSVIIPWLKETYGCRVIAYIADVGQGDDYAALKKKAVKSGADKVVVDDLKKQFIETFCYPMLKSGALYENRYLMGTSIARPIIAAGQVACAKREKADAVSHGATGKGNDQVRFELTYMMLAPKLTVIAAWKDPNWTIKSREDAIRYAKKHKIPVPVSKKKPYSIDQNIWHTSYEGGVLENPWNTPIKGMHDTVAPLEKTPANGQTVTLQFKQGIPVAVDGKKMGAVALLTKLNKMAGKHGVGRVDMVENRLVGIKSRGVYDTPGGTVLYAAHRELEQLVLDRDTLHFKDQVALRYGELVYNGQWFCDLREAIDAFISRTQRYVTGTVRLTLYKGSCIPAGKKSPYSRYDMDLATFEEDDIYDQKDATGFIKLFGLPMKKSHGAK